LFLDLEARDKNPVDGRDGKKIKDAAKWLKPTRGYAGKLIGAKALDFDELSRVVAADLRSGLALAMSDSLDGAAWRAGRGVADR
jgi:hypothetical protein